MAQYVKKRVVVEAFCLDGNIDYYPGWFTRALVEGSVNPVPGDGAFKGVSIKTLEGNMLAQAGDWVIKGVEGELYPCKPSIFEKTYEALPMWAETR